MRKANVNEIIRVRGREKALYLVKDCVVEKSQDGIEYVTYTCLNIDDPSDKRIILEVDVMSIAVVADKSAAFIKKRSPEPKKMPPAVQPPQQGNKPFTADQQRMLDLFAARKAEQPKQSGKPKQKTPREIERIRQHETREYIDFLLDRYNDLISLQTVLGEDEERTAEIAAIREEFPIKVVELYGDHTGGN